MLLKDFVNMKMANADKEANAEGVPLTLNNCKKYKKMRDLKVYGNCLQDGTPTVDNPIEVQSVGELVTDETDSNYGKYKIPVVQRGKNLFREDLIPKATSDRGITCDYEGNGIFHIYGENTNNTESVRYYTLAYFNLNIPLEQTKYTGYVKLLSGSDIYYMCPYFHTSNGASTVQWMPIGVNASSVIGQTYKNTVAYNYGLSDASMITKFHIFSYTDAGRTIKVDMRIQIWLVEGNSGDVPFEPYVEPITTNIFLDEPLRKLSSYADYIDFKNNKVVRKCCKRNLASYTYSLYDKYVKNEVEICHFHAGDWEIIPSSYYDVERYNANVGKSNVMPTYADYNYGWYTYGMIMWGWGQNIRFAIPTEYIGEASATAFQNWLSEHNAYMVRVLATPIEEPLNIDLPKLNAKTTIIEVDTSLAPGNISGKYILR